jgi:hypothetical protein
VEAREMRFEHVRIGQKFFHAISSKQYGVFEKKSLSSAYTLDPASLGRCDVEFTAVPGILGFGKAVEVYPLEAA